MIRRRIDNTGKKVPSHQLYHRRKIDERKYGIKIYYKLVGY